MIALSWLGMRLRCAGCGRFLSESQVSGYDLKRRWFWCERCASRAERT